MDFWVSLDEDNSFSFTLLSMLIYMQDTYNVKYSDSVLSSSELSQSL